MRNNIKSITLDGECERRHCKTYDSLAEFDLALHCIASDEERTSQGGYCKVFFTITFDDGEEYAGRVDMHRKSERQETSTGKISLEQHIQDHVLFIWGYWLPRHMTIERQLPFVSEPDPEWIDRLGIEITPEMQRLRNKFNALLMERKAAV